MSMFRVMKNKFKMIIYIYVIHSSYLGTRLWLMNKVQANALKKEIKHVSTLMILQLRCPRMTIRPNSSVPHSDPTCWGQFGLRVHKSFLKYQFGSNINRFDIYFHIYFSIFILNYGSKYPKLHIWFISARTTSLPSLYTSFFKYWMINNDQHAY